MASNKESKARLRAAMLDRRARFSVREQKEAGFRAGRRLSQRKEIFDSLNIALYWSFRGELSTRELSEFLRRAGKRLFYPRLTPKRDTLEFVAVDRPDHLAKGAFGIWEPKPSLPPIPLKELDVIVVPGVVFDLLGNRIGWGKGCYDRILKKFKGKRVGFGYDFQVLDYLPSDRHDQSVHAIVTEKREIYCRTR